MSLGEEVVAAADVVVVLVVADGSGWLEAPEGGRDSAERSLASDFGR